MRYTLNERKGSIPKPVIPEYFESDRLEIYVQRTRPEIKGRTLFVTIGRWIEKGCLRTVDKVD